MYVMSSKNDKDSTIVNVEVGDLVAWEWITVPGGKNYAMGNVGIVLDVWETVYTFAALVSWAGVNKSTIFSHEDLLVISKYSDLQDDETSENVVFVWESWPEDDD